MARNLVPDIGRKTARRVAMLCLAVCAFALAPRPAVCAPATASAESISYNPGDSVIKAFVLIAGRESGARYSFIAGADEGIKTLNISAGDKILNRKECYGAQICRIEGANAKAEIPGEILTVEAISSTNRAQREKIKMNFETAGDRVYTITALPGTAGQPVLIASADPGKSTGTVQPSTGSIEIPLPPQDTGPVITRTVKKTDKGVFSVMALASDPSGVDFIELLENGKFLDVQTCDGAKQCRLDRTLRLDAPGDYSYTIKAMDKLGKVSFQDFPISYED